MTGVLVMRPVRASTVIDVPAAMPTVVSAAHFWMGRTGRVPTRRAAFMFGGRSVLIVAPHVTTYPAIGAADSSDELGFCGFCLNIDVAFPGMPD